MAKNEEKNIRRCLDSAEKIADEIVFVDTGSTDNTIEIAKEYSKVRLFHHPWQNDFSLHRNQCIGHANGEWLFVMDADEELVFLVPEAIDLLRLDLEKAPRGVNCLALFAKDILSGSESMEFVTQRFFRKGCVRYENIVHNRPVIQTEKSHFINYLLLRHYGYDLSLEDRKKKFMRTLGLLNKRLEQDPEDHEVYFYLCQLWGWMEDHNKSMMWAEKYLAVRDKVKGFNRSVFFTAYRSYFMKGDLANAKRWLDLALEADPDDLDANIAAVEYAITIQDSDMAIRHAEHFLAMFGKFDQHAIQRPQQFVYSHTPQAFCYVSQQLAIVQIARGIFTISRMEQVAKGTPDEFRKSLDTDLTARLGALGIVRTHKFEISAEGLSQKEISN